MTDRQTLTWVTQHEDDGFPVRCAAVGEANLSVIHIGQRWLWLVRRHGTDIAEGIAESLAAAQQAAEAAATERILARPETIK
jgi:hypothetical protein